MIDELIVYVLELYKLKTWFAYDDNNNNSDSLKKILVGGGSACTYMWWSRKFDV